MRPDVAILAMLEAATAGKPTPDGRPSPESLRAVRRIAKACCKPKPQRPTPNRPEPPDA